MEDHGNGGTGQNVSKFPARGSRSQSGNRVALAHGQVKPKGEHYSTYQRGGREAAREAHEMKLINVIVSVTLAVTCAAATLALAGVLAKLVSYPLVWGWGVV